MSRVAMACGLIQGREAARSDTVPAFVSKSRYTTGKRSEDELTSTRAGLSHSPQSSRLLVSGSSASTCFCNCARPGSNQCVARASLR